MLKLEEQLFETEMQHKTEQAASGQKRKLIEETRQKAKIIKALYRQVERLEESVHEHSNQLQVVKLNSNIELSRHKRAADDLRALLYTLYGASRGCRRICIDDQRVGVQ